MYLKPKQTPWDSVWFVLRIRFPNIKRATWCMQWNAQRIAKNSRDLTAAQQTRVATQEEEFIRTEVYTHTQKEKTQFWRCPHPGQRGWMVWKGCQGGHLCQSKVHFPERGGHWDITCSHLPMLFSKTFKTCLTHHLKGRKEENLLWLLGHHLRWLTHWAVMWPQSCAPCVSITSSYINLSTFIFVQR